MSPATEGSAISCSFVNDDGPIVIASITCALAYTIYGACYSALSAALPPLANHLEMSTSAFGFAYTTRGVGYLLGTLTSAYFLNFQNFSVSKSFLTSMALLISGVTMFLTAYAHNFTMMLILFSIQGVGFGGVDMLANCALPELWGVRAQPWMQIMHTGFGVGAILGPALVGLIGYQKSFIIITFFCLVPITLFSIAVLWESQQMSNGRGYSLSDSSHSQRDPFFSTSPAVTTGNRKRTNTLNTLLLGAGATDAGPYREGCGDSNSTGGHGTVNAHDVSGEVVDVENVENSISGRDANSNNSNNNNSVDSTESSRHSVSGGDTPVHKDRRGNNNSNSSSSNSSSHSKHHNNSVKYGVSAHGGGAVGVGGGGGRSSLSRSRSAAFSHGNILTPSQKSQNYASYKNSALSRSRSAVVHNTYVAQSVISNGPLSLKLTFIAENDDEDDENSSLDEEKPVFLVPSSIKYLTCGFYFIYMGFAAGYSSWITTYSLDADVTSSDAAAAYLVSIYWIAMTVGRLLAMLLAMKFSGAAMLRLKLTQCVAASVLLLFVANTSYSNLAIATALIGFSVSSIFPLVMTVIQDFGFTMDASATNLFMMGTTTGDSVLPVAIGYIIEFFGNASFSYTMIACAIGLVLFYAAIHLLGRDKSYFDPLNAVSPNIYNSNHNNISTSSDIRDFDSDFGLSTDRRHQSGGSISSVSGSGRNQCPEEGSNQTSTGGVRNNSSSTSKNASSQHSGDEGNTISHNNDNSNMGNVVGVGSNSDGGGSGGQQKSHVVVHNKNLNSVTFNILNERNDMV